MSLNKNKDFFFFAFDVKSSCSNSFKNKSTTIVI